MEGSNVEGNMGLVASFKGSGGAGAEIREEIKQQVIRSNPELRVGIAANPIEGNFPDWLKQIEGATMAEDEVDRDITNFVQTAETYYQNVAENEGFVNEGEKMDFRVRFIAKSKYQEVVSPALRDHGGFFEQFSNTVYVRYPEQPIGKEEKFGLMELVAHELRHRVGARHLYLEMSQDQETGDLGVQLQDISPQLASFHAEGTRYGVMEEIYVLGFENEHLREIPDPTFQQLLSEKKEHMRLIGNNPDNYVTSVFNQETGRYEPRKYFVYNQLYKLLKDEMPDFMDKCTKVRQGLKGAKGELARSLVEVFGKKGLALLVYADQETAAVALSGLRNITRAKQETGAEKEITDKMVDQSLRGMLMNRPQVLAGLGMAG